MPRGKKMKTPSKEPGSSSMTQEEEEEMLYDISKLQEQVQQVSLAQKATESKMDGLRKYVEVKIDGLRKGVEAKIDGMDDKMEELKINMNKLLQEMVNKGERVLKETQDENKRNVNHDSIDSNVGTKTHHIPKIDMKKFDVKDLATWILQMEQFFDLNNVQNTQKGKNIPEEHRIDVFIGNLKDNIQHDVHLWEPNSLEKAFRLARKMESKIMSTRKHTTHNYKDGSVVSLSLPQPIRLTAQQLEEKREKGLCYSCDSKYTKGHKCAEKKLFYIDCEEEEEKEQERSKEEDILKEQSLDEEKINPTISCNALVGITTPQTIKIEGQIKKKKVIVSIDSGSNHNFFHWKLGKIISSNGMTKLLKKEQRGVIAQLCLLDVSTSESSISPDLQKVLDNHSKVFETRKGLPLVCDHDHAIHLIPGSVAPNIRPYRYPYVRKSEIEHMIAEMLETGIIQPSQSSFSAPVVFVHKKDGSWRMCPDYRELNKLTIKDKFPIPFIDELLDELLDELHGSIYFTKLDLRSGYHQIKMKTEDIPKTTFRTHEGRYEFLVMPFGLTNAPSTFQGLMNSILKPFLRKFVLVFSDDILIYNKSWKDHVQHVERVLKLLGEKQLYAKSSKCFFGVREVEYLGHIVSHESVKVDPSKIKAIKEWKIPTSIKHL
eukprot:PITA_06560